MASNPLGNRNRRADRCDPHLDDGWGPLPRIPPGFATPSKKVQAQWIWPRDKDRGSWGRFKDIVTGRGPDIYVGRSDQYAPTKATWSNWSEPIYDSLGYRDEWDKCKSRPRRKKYDFRTRRYVDNWQHPKVWSDVKWEPGRNPDMPLYWRDAAANEFTQRAGFIPAAWQSPAHRANAQEKNDFRYNPNSANWNWTDPEPAAFWNTYAPSA